MLAGVAARTCLAVASLVALLSPASAGASNLITPGVGAAELGVIGSNVARPTSPTYAVFVNPAALVNFERRTEGFTFGFGVGSSKVNSPDFGYRSESDFMALAPDYGVAWSGEGPWKFGFTVMFCYKPL